jgi:hypothetical protein
VSTNVYFGGKMKKLFILACISVLLFFSCVVTSKIGIVFDDSIPIEKSSEIVTYSGVIKGYNGISVDWKPSMSNSVQIPAGDTILEFEIASSIGNTIYRGSGWFFKYNFLPNKKYILWFNVKDELWGMNVYTYEIGEKIPVMTVSGMEPNLTAFVSFLNATKEKQKTVLD